MGYQDFTDGAVLSAAQMDEMSKQGVLQYGSTAARDSDAALAVALREGIMVYVTATNTLYVYSGSVWTAIGPVNGALTSFSPVWQQDNAISYTNQGCRWSRIGRRIFYSGYLTATTAGTAGNGITVQLPVQAADATLAVVGSGRFYDQSGVVYWPGVVTLPVDTALAIMYDASGSPGGMIGNSGFVDAVAANDVITWSVTYESAGDL